ncbi:NUDIX hydrolase [Chitinophaga flava]|nr:NUDIX domain-containing protein [Chitinophaga flava]
MKQFHEYKNPSLAVDLVIFGYHDNTLSVLLLNRKEEPFKDCWTLPGGFLQMDETFRDTCSRILKTKTGIDDVFLEQLYSFDDPARDPRGRVIAVGYYALINPARFNIIVGSMANDVKWFNVLKMPRLGFDHQDIFQIALQRLRSKILYYPVGFELLDELFTITELHELYECILQTTLDRRNFRRKILDANYVINTGTKREGLQNRHPDLYKFNKKLKKNSFQINVNAS